ncbi:DUF1109 domain-containing protein [Roseomonas sp. GC11]|uniref:NrsF family protein n=1 Tax=Roseomonas sp. GC11 TaxID=2950546 RepID=UPI002109F0FA|nr:DUF1109 domain-containing protein [Roseomonas sp. GC11]MCQ4160977.1 DUF1109 domain-containing protein [Roseomonas sp. GC11]
MRTNELISALVQDQAMRRWRLEGVLLCGLAIGGGMTALGFLAGLGLRPDLESAVMTLRVLLKLVVSLGLLVVCAGLTLRLARPGVPVGGWRWGAPALALLLAGAVAAELLATPPASWSARMMGQNALFCLALIPALAAGPLACLLLALRQGAPIRPGLSGALAGLAAGGMGAAFYALHCIDDSPLFLVVWYGLGIGFVALLGAVLGRYWLRW